MGILDRMKWLLFFLGLVVLVLWLRQCGRPAPETIRFWLEKNSMLGEHELWSLEKSSEVSGNVDGNFLLGTGNISGKISSEPRLTFTWERQGASFVTTLPLTYFRLIVYPKGPPTVRFLFSEKYLDSSQEKDFPQEVRGNPNWFLMVGREYQRDYEWGWDRKSFPILFGVEVCISKEDAAKLIPLIK